MSLFLTKATHAANRGSVAEQSDTRGKIDRGLVPVWKRRSTSVGKTEAQLYLTFYIEACSVLVLVLVLLLPVVVVPAATVAVVC